MTRGKALLISTSVLVVALGGVKVAVADPLLYIVTQNNISGVSPVDDTNTLVYVNPNQNASTIGGIFTTTTIGLTTFAPGTVSKFGLPGSVNQTAEIRGLAYDNLDQTMYGIYGSSRGNDNMTVIDQADGSTSLLSIYADGIDNVQEIAFGPESGMLYVIHDSGASNDNAILGTYDFTTHNETLLGVLPFEIEFIGADGNGTYGAGGLGFGRIPEPSTWLMLLLGFVGFGFAGYRKGSRKPLAI